MQFPYFKKKTYHIFSEAVQMAKSIFNAISIAYKAMPLLAIAYLITIIGIFNIPILVSYLQSLVIDELINSATTNQITESLTTIILIFLAAFILRTIISILNDYIQKKMFFEYDKLIQLGIVEKFSTLDFEYFESPKFNNLIQKVRQNQYEARRLFLQLHYFIGDFSALVAVVGILFAFSPLILLLIIISNIPKVISEFALGRSSWGIWDYKPEDYRNHQLAKFRLTDEDSLREIKVFRAKDYLYNIVKKIYNEFISYQINIENRRLKYSLIFTLISFVAFGYSFYILINQVVIGAITIGLFTFYFSTLNTFSSTINAIFKRISNIYEAGLFTNDYVQFMNLPKLLRNGTEILDSKNPPEIEFKNVWFKYPETEKYIFKDFNLKIKPGQRIAIVGENGAGKTTLISLILRIYDVSKGEILINGKNIKDYNLDSYYKSLALLSQDFIKYHFNVKTNIGIGNIDEINNMNKLTDSAKFSGADKFVEKYTGKYDQILSKRFTGGIDPSEGQWQKIALARAFYKDAPILILDEPTSAIDPKSEAEIFERLFTHAKEKTVIIISHRFSTVRNADQILVMQDGKVIEEGSHKDLIEINGVYKEAYDLQKKGYID